MFLLKACGKDENGKQSILEKTIPKGKYEEIENKHETEEKHAKEKVKSNVEEHLCCN